MGRDDIKNKLAVEKTKKAVTGELLKDEIRITIAIPKKVLIDTI